MSNNLEMDKAIKTVIEEYHNLLKESLGEKHYNRLYGVIPNGFKPTSEE